MKTQNELLINCPACSASFAFSHEHISQEYLDQVTKKAMAEINEDRKKLEKRLMEENKLKLNEYKVMARKEIKESIEKELNEKKTESEIQAEVLKEQNSSLMKELTALRKNINDIIKEKQKSLLELELAKKDKDLLVERSVLDAVEKQKNILKEEFNQQMEKMNFENQLQIKEKDQKMKELQNKIEGLQKATQKEDSRIHGEALELVGEDILKEFAAHHNDLVEEIKKGQNGSDFNYTVTNEKSKIAGKATIEFKRVEKFQKSFIKKALDDMKMEESSYAIICSTTLPQEFERITIVDDKLFIMGPMELKHFLKILRKIIIDEYRSSIINKSHDSLKEKVFSLVTSKEFLSQLNNLHKNLCSLSEGIETDYKKIELALKKRRLECDRSIELLVDTFLNLHNAAPQQIQKMESLELSDN
jgi:hypothetical protein